MTLERGKEKRDPEDVLSWLLLAGMIIVMGVMVAAIIMVVVYLGMLIF